VQSEEFILSHGGKLGDVAIYGQEANPTTWRLAAMNLAIRGIDFNLGREPADTFTNDQFKDLRATSSSPTHRSTSATGGTRAWWAKPAGTTATRRRATPTAPGFSTCCTT
jgi:N-6 DNA Methylase